MTTGMIRISIAALAGMSIAAYGQNNVATGLPTGVAVQSGAASLDSAGIVTGEPLQPGPPGPTRANGSAMATPTVTPK